MFLTRASPASRPFDSEFLNQEQQTSSYYVHLGMSLCQGYGFWELSYHILHLIREELDRCIDKDSNQDMERNIRGKSAIISTVKRWKSLLRAISEAALWVVLQGILP